MSTGPRLAVITKNRTNPAYAGARAGIDRRLAALGAEAVHYVPDIPDDVDQQTALIHEAIASGPDAIVLAPAHATRLNAAIDAIGSAEIPLFFFVSETTPSPAVCYVGSDDGALAEAMAERLAAHLDGRGRVVLVNGHPDAATSAPRRDGFRRALARYPAIKVVGEYRGDYQYDAAATAFRRALEEHTLIDGVLASNDFMALAVIDGLADAGRRAAVVGANATPAGIDAIKAGTMLASAAFDALSMGALAAEAAVRVLGGGTVPVRMMLPAEIVEAGNLGAWDCDYADRAIYPWDRAVAGG